MKVSNIRNLGEVTSRLVATTADEAEGYGRDLSGDCHVRIARGVRSVQERIVKRFGFANLHHFLAVLERRTSAKYVYTLGIHP